MSEAGGEWDGQLLADISPELAGRVIFLEECASTNDEARRLADLGAAHGTLVLAEKQTAGRGRRGQAWACPVGEGIACSLIIRPEAPTPLWSRIAIATGLGVAESLDLPVEVKWPNDLWLNGKKLCGILVESTGNAVVVGIGMNVNVKKFPEGLAHPATSILLETGTPASREVVLAGMIERVIYRTSQIEGEFGSLISSWNTRCALRGKLIRCLRDGKPITGMMEGLSLSGELLLRNTEGLQRILQADEIRLV